MHCVGSVVLPQASHTGADAEAGVEKHGKVEAGDTSIDVVARVLDGATSVRHEAAYALNIRKRTARLLGIGIRRRYDVEPDEMPMTLDLEAMKAGVWWVVDWKSRERVTPAERNWQLGAGALAVMATNRVSRVNVAIGYLDDSTLDGPVPIDAFDAPKLWADLEQLLEKIEDAKTALDPKNPLDVHAGSWCKYCPAVPHCPAHRNLALSLLGELDKFDIEGKISTLEPHQQGRVYNLLKQYDKVRDRISDTLGALARQQPIPLGEGKVLAAVECQGRRAVDEDKVRELLGKDPPYKRGKGFVQLKVINQKEEAAE